jgi:Na+-transporting methylmalonyl-CoA/oxaloacetate decarboxylase gamma subunit
MLRRLRKRIQAGAIATMLIGPLLFFVVAFLAIAIYFALLELMSPAMAALATSGVGILLILLVILVMAVRARRARVPELPPEPEHDPLETLLQENADPILRAWVRSNPDKAVIATLVLGIAAGYSEPVRRSLMDMYTRYVEAERERRERRSTREGRPR